MKKTKLFIALLFIFTLVFVGSQKAHAEESLLRSEKEMTELLAAIPEGYEIAAENPRLRAPSGLFGQAHVRDLGWLNAVNTGSYYVGTTGLNKPIEAIKLNFTSDYKTTITYRLHVQDLGWLPFVSNGAVAGTTGRAKKAEAIQIRTSGPYKVMYRGHVTNKGWLKWTLQDSDYAGTVGQNLGLESLDIVILRPI